MGLTVALFATLALATSADAPQDAATWRAQSDAFDHAINEGKNPASLGRPVIGGNLTADDLSHWVPKLAKMSSHERAHLRARPTSAGSGPTSSCT